MARDATPSVLEHTAGIDRGLMSEILEGLSRPRKALPPKLFYDERGSRLFERICEQPEYYIPAAETALLQSRAGELAAFCGPHCVVIEPGAGTAGKTPILLRALERPAAYVPIEISQTALDVCLSRLAALMPDLRVHPLCADFTRPFGMPRIDNAQWSRRVLFVPGSTIGNFEPQAARRLLAEWQALAGPRGALVIGVDLCKPRAILERAYDDAAGVTAAFNLNMLEHLNRDFGANFNIDAFEHRAIFNQDESRIEMHLLSKRPQRVRIGGRSFLFAAGETLHTENSYKYRPADFAEIALSAGWARRELWIDDRDLFSVQCFEAIA
jgi:L-histidine N-alpha-methyltransferase